jgi:hypothetical protein
MTMMSEKHKKKEILNWQFVQSDLFDHLFAYTKQLSEIAESLYLELDDSQRQAVQFEKQMREESKKKKRNDD